jgi:hypothetical protein
MDPTFDNKAGWRTTEFYVTLLTALLPIFTTVFHTEFTGTQVQAWSTLAAAIATVGYSMSRSRSKDASMMAKAQAMAPATPAPVATATGASASAPAEAVATLPLETVVSILARLEYLTESVKEKDRDVHLDH